MYAVGVDGVRHNLNDSQPPQEKEENEQVPRWDTSWLGESFGNDNPSEFNDIVGGYAEYEGEGQEHEVEVKIDTQEFPVRPLIPARPGICARFPVPTFDNELDVFLMVRRKKTTIFIDAKEDTEVLELKRMIAGITKVMPEAQKLFRDNNELDDKKKISDYGLNAGTAKPQLPATIALVFKDDNGEWERIDMAPLSQPPELPEVMRQQEPSNADAP